MATGEPPAIATGAVNTSQTGPLWTLLPSERRTQVWLLMESDVRLLNSYGLMSTMFFALATFFAGLAASIKVQYLMTAQQTAAGQVLNDIGFPVLGGAVAVCVGVGLFNMWRRGGEWDRIKRETKQLGQMTVARKKGLIAWCKEMVMGEPASTPPAT